MAIICGADGCKGGWVVISKDLDSGQIAWRLRKTAHDLIALSPLPKIIAIDIPIGLPEKGSRACDLLARELLGKGRTSSVFPAPIRPVLAAQNYIDACKIRLVSDGKKMSKQAWNIVPKIRSVDTLLVQNPELRTIIREVHPEVCFFYLNGKKPLHFKKKMAQGREERITLLEPLYGQSLRAASEDRKKLDSGEDDILDAFAALWTAERIEKGTSQTIPAEPPTDSYGLRMEIVA